MDQKPLPQRYVLIGLGLMLALQVFIVDKSFRARADIFNPEPALNVDFCSQYYWSYAAREFYKQDKKLWGYDPFFMAGYPLDFVFNSSLPVQMISVAAAEAPLGRVIKIVFMVSVLLAPFNFYFSMRLFGLARGPALAASALGLAVFWAAETGWFAHMGMISGAFLMHFFLVPLAALYRFLFSRDLRAFGLFLFALPIAFTVHKTAFVLVLPLALIWIAMHRKIIGSRELTVLTAAFAFAALANLHWLYPFFKFLPLKIEDPGTTFFQGGSPLRLLTDLMPIPPYQPFWGMALVRLVIVALGILGLQRMRWDKDGLLKPLIVGLVFFGALAYFGSLAPPLRHLQPHRYVSAYFFFWLPAAGYGLKTLHEKSRAVMNGEVFSPIIFGLALIAVLRFTPTFVVFSVLAPLTTELDQDSKDLVSWVQESTDPSARILIEDINVWEPKPGESALYGGARLVHLLPLLAPRELIGGPLPNAFIKHHYAGFHDGWFLDRPIHEFTDAELDEAMRLYNIGWVIAWTDESKVRFRNYEKAVILDGFGRIDVFRIDREPSFFLSGSGEVSASFNRIHLTGLSSEAGRVVISYHWVDGLKSEPPAKLERVDLGNDPVGFIGIKEPSDKLTIKLGH